jgi:hypothetical protein
MPAEYLDLLKQACEAQGVRADERAFSYILGLGLPPAPSLELALEALRRAGETSGSAAPDCQAVMTAVRDLLRERGVDPEGREGGGGPGLSSTPPLNRRAMIAEEMDLSFIRRLRRRLFSAGTPRLF